MYSRDALLGRTNTEGIEQMMGRGADADSSADGRRVAVVIDHHPLYRDALVTLLNTLDLFLAVRDHGSVEAYAHAPEEDVGLILTDLGPPGATGVAAVLALAAGRAPVLVLSAETNTRRIRDALDAGAVGFVPKSAPTEDVMAAAQAVAGGRAWIHPTVAADLLVSAAPTLSARENEVLALLATGATDRAIGRALTISVSTVRTHLARIRNKTGRRRRAGLVRFAMETEVG